MSEQTSNTPSSIDVESIQNNGNVNKSIHGGRSRKDIKTVVEFTRKLIYSLNGDSPSNITFGETDDRVYFLGNTRKGDTTIKYIDMSTAKLGEKLIGQPLFDENSQQQSENGGSSASSSTTRQLTKEEQLLRERKRCSFNGITSFCLEPSANRLVFSENSDLFYFDDKHNLSNEQPIFTSAKGAIDVKICPDNPDLVSYIINDNLYVQNVATGREYQLTQSKDPVKSAVPSYAVQEEFNRYTGYWWQPQTHRSPTTSYRIIYEEVDDGCVDLIYVSPSCENEFGVDTYRYPKAGARNSRTELKLIEFTFHPDQESNIPPFLTRKRMLKSFYDLFDWYEYFVRGEWTPDGQYFWALIYDRLQQRTQSMLIPLEFFVPYNSAQNDQSMETSSYMDETRNILLLNQETANTWINYNNVMYFGNNNQSRDANSLSFITALEDTGFFHLYSFQVSLAEQDLEFIADGLIQSKSVERRQLTSGDWCLDGNESIHVDEANSLIYFTAYKDPLESHLFVVDMNQANKIRQITENGFSHRITMNKKCNNFLSICSNLSTQHRTYLYELSNQEKGVDGLVIKQICQIISREDQRPTNVLMDTKVNELKSNYATVNSLLGLNLDTFVLNNSPVGTSPNETTIADESAIVQHLFKPPQIFSFETDDGCKLYGMIYMPLNYEHGVKYPTVLYVYGGPKVQLVNNSYKSNKYSRFNILALLGYCTVIIDSRGSDCRGKKFEEHLYTKMGTVEIQDQVKGIEFAARTFNCIDMKRIGVFGWSYGGYMSLMALAQRPDIFKVAISGAPVTSWELYDTAYTERYMGLPVENRKQYDMGSVLHRAAFFPNDENRLLIIHGMIDENVHFVHTRKLIDALIKANKPYQIQIYPNERHGIRSPDASLHCDVNLYSFLEQNL